ncbi:helix-turn-helix transcriptional regulator [Streptomyces ossamyceticus]|uniref:helix-turn-helix transcriptional regulator n=1 Tax=Streptomyces ossamyceticus TaxID=249581 RepID=UPI0006E413AE|nr:helix-turn-helix transcriptional regulator [Streptomyces ossamyceticus]
MTEFSEYVTKAARDAGYEIDAPRGGGRKALAEATGMSQSAVGRMLSGATTPSVYSLRSLASVLAVPFEEMLDRSGVAIPPRDAGSAANSGVRVDGIAIRRLRIERGHGMNRFAEAAGISAAALSRIETGRRNPLPETLKKITDALGCGITDVVLGDIASCPRCKGAPPAGFTCNTCGAGESS